MANRTKVQDEQEVLRWLEEGKPYRWMVDEYLDKYNIETSISMWAGIRRKYGFDRRNVRDDDLIPWEVKEEHRYAHPITMLRGVARQRAGRELSQTMTDLVDGWLRGMERDGTVLHYDPDTEDGWWYVPRRPGVDEDLIREPERKTTQRRARED